MLAGSIAQKTKENFAVYVCIGSLKAAVNVKVLTCVSYAYSLDMTQQSVTGDGSEVQSHAMVHT